MRMKRLLSGVLAGALALSLSVPAFAAANNNTTLTDISEGAEVEMTSVTKGATIKVLVPTSVMIGLNPYEMNVEFKDGALVDAASKGAQVISPMYTIQNQSTLPINVTVSATGALNGDGMVFATAKPATTDTTKSAFVQMEYAAAAVGATSLTSPKKLTLKDEAVNGDAISLEKYDASSTTAKSNYMFTFSGNLNGKSATPWSDEDTIGATIAFTFAVNPTK